MLTYMTLEGDVLDLSRLTDEERAYLDECLEAFRTGEDSIAFGNERVNSARNPLLRATDGWVTKQAVESPLYWALHDLEDRLGVQQGRFLPRKEDRPDRDPFDDEWLPVTEAARRKGVTVPGLHGAIRRGDVIAAPAKPGGARLVVSRNSLDRWTPNPRRQAAGRQRARARATVAT